MSVKLNRRAFVGAALAAGALAATSPTQALGVTAAQKKAEVQDVKAKLDAIEDEVFAAGDKYNQCMDAYDAATAKVDECQGKIDKAQKKITTLQSHLETRAVTMYRNGQTDYVDVLLGAATFADFATVWDTLNNLNEDDANLVADTKVAKSELESAKKELDEQQAEAKSQLASAKEYKEALEAKETEYNELYDSLSAEYQQLLEEEREAAARAAAAAAAAYTPAVSTTSSTSDSSSSGNSGSSSNGDSGDSDSGDSDGGSSSSSGGAAASSIPTNGSVVDYAASRLGCPYVWGASGPNSFDCSGLVMWCYAQIGISLPHYTESQYACARARLDPSAAQPGDVLYRSGHVAISTGGTNYIHAPHTGDVVRHASGGSWVCALRF